MQTYSQIQYPQIRTTHNSIRDICFNVSRELKPRFIKLPADWADENIILPDTSAKGGTFFNSHEVRYVIEILNSLADPNVDEITIMSSAQIFKTTMGIIMVAYRIANKPVPIMILQPTIDAAEKYSKTKLEPVLLKIRGLAPLFNRKSRDSKNTVRYKEGAGWFIIIAGANSPVDLASHSVGIVLSEEIDRIPPSAGEEGDPVELAEQRTESYSLYGFKHIRLGTPTIDKRSRIQKKYLAGDQRKFFVYCPHCGYKQTLEFFPKKDEEDDNRPYGGVTWEKQTDMFGKTEQHFTETAYYVCANKQTKCKITERDKRVMIADPRAEWIVTNPGVKRHRSYHLNRLYSPLSTFVKLAKKFIDAKDDPDDLKVFYNTSLGITWKEDITEEIDELGLMRSLLNYLTEEDPYLPNEVLLLTCAVDVQADRLEVSVEGWGIGEENWLVHYEQFWGDPDQIDVWNQLDQFLEKKWMRKDGVELGLGGFMFGRRNYATVVDSGYKAVQAVYEYCRRKQMYGVIAIKGRGGAGLPVLLNRSKAGKNRDVILQNLGTDALQEIIWRRLNRSIMVDGYKPAGPKVCHFTTAFCDADYFSMLLAKRPFKTYDKSFGDVWLFKKLKKGSRDEPWDLKQYNYAAMKMVNPNFELLRETLLKQKEEKKEAEIERKKISGKPMKITRVIK